MQENLGWTKLAEHTRAESVDEMKHAEVLTDRILLLEGLPNTRGASTSTWARRSPECSRPTGRSRSRRLTGCFLKNRNKNKGEESTAG